MKKLSQLQKNHVNREGQAEKAHENFSFFRLLPWLWLAAAYISVIVFLILYGRTYLDSDTASEMILSDLLNKEGVFLSRNWWYSTELRIVHLQIVFRPLLLLFPDNWTLVRILGMALVLLGMAVSFFYAADGLGLKKNAVWGCAAILCPFGTWYLSHVIYSGAYLLYIILVLLNLGLVLHLIRENHRIRYWVQFILYTAICMIGGLNGVRMLMNFYVPLIAAALLAFVLYLHEHPAEISTAEIIHRQESKLLFLSFYGTVVSAAGYLINSKVLMKMYQFRSYNVSVWGIFDLNKLLECWGGFLSLFGWQVDSFQHADKVVPFFSLEGILNVCGLVTACLIVFSLWRLLLRWRELSFLKRLPGFLLMACLAVNGAVFAFGDVGSNASYWLAILPLTFYVLQTECETEHFHIPAARKVAAVGFALCIIGSSYATVKEFLAYPLRAHPNLEPVTEWMLDNGYTKGYATFWEAGILTEWSSGQIEVWAVDPLRELQIHEWLQPSSHSVPPEGEVFLLATQPELESTGLSALAAGPDVVYQDANGYVIMAYDSADELKLAVQAAGD